jgi:hypothetical protein
MASDLSGRTLAMVHAHTRRWRVAGGVQACKADDGWGTWTQQPGEAGSRRSVLLSLLGAHGRLRPPAQHAQLKHNRPAETVGSLRAHVQGACVVAVSQERVAVEDLQAPRHRLTQAVHDGLA